VQGGDGFHRALDSRELVAEVAQPWQNGTAIRVLKRIAAANARLVCRSESPSLT
jgi:hypothetical protein